jgi:hypothetical protein
MRACVHACMRACALMWRRDRRASDPPSRPLQQASYLYSTTQADPNATYATIPLLDHPHHGSQRVGLPVTGNPTLLQGLDGSGIAYQEPRAFP